MKKQLLAIVALSAVFYGVVAAPALLSYSLAGSGSSSSGMRMRMDTPVHGKWRPEPSKAASDMTVEQYLRAFNAQEVIGSSEVAAK